MVCSAAWSEYYCVSNKKTFRNLHAGEDKGDNSVQHKGNCEVHEPQHIDAGFRLHGQRLIVVAECKQPAGDGGAEISIRFDTQRSAGIHCNVYALVLRQPSVLGARGDNGVYVTLPRVLTQCSNGREKKHHLDIAGARIADHRNERTDHGGKGITADVQLIHTVHFGNKRRGKDQCDNQRNVDGSREHVEQVFVAKNMGGVIGAHTNHGTVMVHDSADLSDSHSIA